MKNTRGAVEPELKRIITAAADLEDGETGIDGGIHAYCRTNGIDSETADRACELAFKTGALAAGIPLSVIEGRTRLRDHFSQEYINAQVAPSDWREKQREQLAELRGVVEDCNAGKRWLR